MIKHRTGGWIKVMGWLTALLGIVHLAYTPLLYRKIAALEKDQLYTFLYMFIATGAAVVLSGVLLVYCAGWMNKGERWARITSLANGFFLLFLGVGAVAMMGNNPFAYIMLVMAILTVGPQLLLSQPMYGEERKG